MTSLSSTALNSFRVNPQSLRNPELEQHYIAQAQQNQQSQLNSQATYQRLQANNQQLREWASLGASGSQAAQSIGDAFRGFVS